jgi:GNAT superfamily N-acetyltransferase
MVTLRRFKQSYYEALNSYHLNDIQSEFTRDVNFCLNERKDLEDPNKTVVAILSDEVPVGFFVLDTGNDKYRYTNNPASILIRSLSMNPEQQGKGIGKEAMRLVSKFVSENLQGVEEMVLAVNFKNENAYWVYRKADFRDDGKVVEGRKGPQHVLTKRLI